MGCAHQAAFDGNAPISWAARANKASTRSTAEADFMSINSVAVELIDPHWHQANASSKLEAFIKSTRISDHSFSAQDCGTTVTDTQSRWLPSLDRKEHQKFSALRKASEKASLRLLRHLYIRTAWQLRPSPRRAPWISALDNLRIYEACQDFKFFQVVLCAKLHRFRRR